MKSKSFREIIMYEDLIEKWSSMRKSDPFGAWNIIQLKAAMRLIHHYFGDNWYRKNIDKDLTINDSSISHPLNDALWSGDPSKLIRILFIGISLRVLTFDKPAMGLLSKIPKLREATSSFEKTSYELKCAATYASAGFNVSFIAERDDRKTPDLLVKGTSEEIFIECKKRDQNPSGEINRKINGALDRIRDAHSQIKEANGFGIVYLELDDNLPNNHPYFHKYIENISTELKFLKKIQCVVITSLNTIKTEDIIHQVTEAYGIPNDSTPISITREIWCNPSVIGRSFPKYILDIPKPKEVNFGLPKEI